MKGINVTDGIKKSAEQINRGRIQEGQFKRVLPEGTIKLRFDSVWMGVTGGAMAGATSRGGGGVNIFVNQQGTIN